MGLTQEDLAREVGVSQSAIAKIERKRMVPNYIMGKRIFETLERLEKGSEKTAKDIMRKKVACVGPEDTIEKAAAIILEKGFSTLPVIRDNKVIGRMSEGKILEAGRENYTQSCVEFMGPPPVTLSEDMPLSVIRGILKRENLVVVVGKGGVVRGILSRSDVI